MSKDIVSTRINDRAIKEVAKEYDISEKNVRKLLKAHSDYFYYKVNKIDLTKDISTQVNRIKLMNIGDIRISEVFIYENEYQRGRYSQEEMSFIRKWFSKSFKAHAHRLNLLISNIKNTITNE